MKFKVILLSSIMALKGVQAAENSPSKGKEEKPHVKSMLLGEHMKNLEVEQPDVQKAIAQNLHQLTLASTQHPNPTLKEIQTGLSSAALRGNLFSKEGHTYEVWNESGAQALGELSRLTEQERENGKAVLVGKKAPSNPAEFPIYYYEMRDEHGKLIGKIKLQEKHFKD